MKKMRWRRQMPGLFTLAAVLVCTGCLVDGLVTGNVAFPLTDPEGPSLSGVFTAAPVLTFSGDIQGGGPYDRDRIRFSFTPASPGNNVTYTVYFAEGIVNEAARIRQDYVLVTERLSGIEYNFAGNPGEWYSAVVVASRGEDEAVSAVRQSSSFSGLTESQGTGTLQSRGRTTVQGARTYFIDWENGDDENDGLSPLSAWKTLTRVNHHPEFLPGDHILLEANSTWNGVSVTRDNFVQQRNERGNGGMLRPRGEGAPGRPIVIDLYRVEKEDDIIKAVYYSADIRPIINGNGTPYIDGDNPYANSGAIHMNDQSHWHIRNIEVTNSFDFPFLAEIPGLRERHWLKWSYNTSRYPSIIGAYDSREPHFGVPKPLYGVYVRADYNEVPITGILIEHIYAHDIQSLHSNNQDIAADWRHNYFGFDNGRPGKAGGGIAVSFTESTVQHNIVRRASYMGIRTYTSDRYMSKLNNFIGNYIEDIFGDGLVISSTRGNPSEWSRIEHNVFKETSAAPNHGTGNFAACWAMNSRYTLFQFNEAYGTVYGWNDGEAWDIDINSNETIYQYNYSHHNAGGSLLMMGTSNGIFRYNISANDGAGTRFMHALQNDGFAPPDAPPVNTNANSYTSWNNGQNIFHYTYTGTTAHANVPLIYNNTFFIGPNVNSVGLVGHNAAAAVSKYVRFYNNIILKAGDGILHLSYGQSGSGHPDGFIINPASGFRNNVLWAYRENPAVGDYTRIRNGAGMAIEELTTQFGNRWFNPRLKISEPGMYAVLRQQRNTVFADTDQNNNDPDRLAAFTSRERLRNRASLFMPVDQAALNALRVGMVIPGTAGPTIDGGWNDGFRTMDRTVGNIPSVPAANAQMLCFFGYPITNPPAVGASQGYFDHARYDPTR
ncbi:MAG: hypothetical protein FWG89_03310 [Treponema sp.]|nr:hypothetical protein [Treponema sp.]